MSVTVGVHEDQKLIETIRDLALEGYEGPGKPQYESKAKYAWLREMGTRLWLDTGDAEAAEAVWSRELEALTTNNTLVNQVVQTGVMDGIISYAARKIKDTRPDISDHDLVIELAFLANAKLALSLVQKFGAHVSVELHPDLGFDVARTLTFARRYYEIEPDYFYVKVPMTPDGFISVRRLSEEGIPVNYTLGFSARQNYLATRFSNPSFVNVFLGRLNQIVEENKLGKPENVGEKVTLASYEMVKSLRETHDSIKTQQIAASLRSGEQILTLAGVDVHTMPPKAAGEYLELDITKDDVRRVTAEELKVDLSAGGPVIEQEMAKLWTIDTGFMEFVEDAVQQADQMTSGKDLVALAVRHDVHLFHPWTPEDHRKLREHGKIPDVSQWPGVPIDDLLSMSALESFAKDQEALDGRIKGLIQKAMS